MIVKLVQHFKAESIAVEVHDFGQIVRGPRHPQMSFRQTCYSVVHRFSPNKKSGFCTVVWGPSQAYKSVSRVPPRLAMRRALCLAIRDSSSKRINEILSLAPAW